MGGNSATFAPPPEATGMGEPTESSPACAGTQTSAVAAAAASPAPAAIMAAPPSTTARSAVPSSASLRLRDEQLAPPSLTKRPKTTPATTCYVFGVRVAASLSAAGGHAPHQA